MDRLNGENYMKKFGLVVLLIAVNCSVQNTPQMTSSGDRNQMRVINGKTTDVSSNSGINSSRSTDVVRIKRSSTFECDALKNYTLEIVEDSNRQLDENVTPKSATIFVDGELVMTVDLPNSGEVKNFTLEKVEKTKNGFKLLADWGGWNNHYNLQYHFKCENQNFYFYKMQIESIGNEDPGDPNNWKKEEKNIDPNVSIEKFSILNYLGN